MSELNEVLFKNKLNILVTSVVQRLTLPLLICEAIVESLTTVYVVPLIVAVSPADALGHLHVPFSK